MHFCCRNDDREILLECQRKGPSSKTFASLATRLNKSSAQVGAIILVFDNSYVDTFMIAAEQNPLELFFLHVLCWGVLEKRILDSPSHCFLKMPIIGILWSRVS